ncbi:VWA domain-containing protein [Kitasatospora cineracea]|uniref:TerF-like vWA domain-containing protein n=1 Tax=Kitasatospora cineracea TaxID=88074 RepID=A0A3N4R1X2_9ACTN|nr:VWA domain-containing protein [Kitasatospora cineracea]RPE27328.1 TerF-like vWA domain-containing protein [Kitasatospora cineracea]
MKLFNLTSTPTAPATAAPLTNLVKSAAVSLTKHGIDQQRAAVYLVLDHSGSMSSYYARGDVQRLAEQALGLSANLDDDGTVPLVYFGSDASWPQDIRIGDHHGIIDRTHRNLPWGSTNYEAAIRAVLVHYFNSDAFAANTPALVIFQTDGEPNSRANAAEALIDAARFPVFWSFVGFGGNVSFLQQLDTLPGRVVDNASFFHADRPELVPDDVLYDAITSEFATWLTAARAAGITR